MRKTTKLITLAIPLIIVLVVLLCGCQPTDTAIEQQPVSEERGVLTGSESSGTVAIEVNGITRSFSLDDSVEMSDINAGDEVVFTYIEAETGLLILTIEKITKEPELLTGRGIYNGQIDSHSVEVEIDGQPVAFSINGSFDPDLIESGSMIEFTYTDDEQRPFIISVDHIEQPDDGENGFLVGEGIYIGQIDPQSVEIQINHAFQLAEDINVDSIEDGALIAFTYIESGQRLIVESIQEVEQPIEGDYIHGTLIGRIDAHSIEVEYFQAFSVGEADLDNVDDGDRVVFTYRSGEYRPELISITLP
jgi:hypothetical protein